MIRVDLLVITRNGSADRGGTSTPAAAAGLARLAENVRKGAFGDPVAAVGGPWQGGEWLRARRAQSTG